MNTDKLWELERKWRERADLEDEDGVPYYTEDQRQVMLKDADELAAALRAEQAVGDEQRARELLAEEYEQAEWHHSALAIRLGRIDRAEGIALRAIRRALGTARQSEGVVVREVPGVIREMREWLMHAEREDGTQTIALADVAVREWERRLGTALMTDAGLIAAAPGGEGEG